MFFWYHFFQSCAFHKKIFVSKNHINFHFTYLSYQRFGDTFHTQVWLSITFEGNFVSRSHLISSVFLKCIWRWHIGVGRVTGGCVWELQGSSLSPTWALATPAHQPRLLRAKRSCKQGDNSHHLPASARYRTSPKKFFLNFPEDMVRTPPWLILRPKKLEK